MFKIVLYGVLTEHNFGGPCLIHGVEELIKEFYGDEYEIVCYQTTKPIAGAVSDLAFPIYQLPQIRFRSLIFEAIKYGLKIPLHDEELLKLFDNISSSNVIANLTGICFCANLSGRTMSGSYLRAIKSALGQFTISFLAKMFGKKTVKCPASFGPMETNLNKNQARFAVKYLFDVVYAREKESRRRMQVEAGINKEIPVCPDLANLMKYAYDKRKVEKTVGIAVSFQVIRQWSSSEPYVNCIANLIKHITEKYGCRILLIPNEVITDKKYHDTHVAHDIVNLLNRNDNVDILDVANMNSTQIKNFIASCEVMVSSRYHSCVAALSAGVPTLVIGWHYKYDELFQWYKQDKWIISSQACTSQKLTTMFDELWQNRKKERKVIKKMYPEVRKAIIEAGKIMLRN